MNNLIENIEKFLIYLDIDKNYSPETLKNYKLWLYRFANFLEVFY